MSVGLLIVAWVGFPSHQDKYVIYNLKIYILLIHIWYIGLIDFANASWIYIFYKF